MRLACGTAGEIGLHVGSYHVPTGTVVAPPCEVLLRTYQVVVKGDEAVKDPQDIGHLTMDLCRLMGAALHTI